MGMFDYFQIDHHYLPIDNHKEFKDEVYQTKSLNNVLDEFFCENQKLYVNTYNVEIVDDKDLPYPDKPFIGCMRRIPTGHELFNYTGEVRFYTRKNEEWYEFIAFFVNGNLIDVFKDESKT